MFGPSLACEIRLALSFVRVMIVRYRHSDLLFTKLSLLAYLSVTHLSLYRLVCLGLLR